MCALAERLCSDRSPGRVCRVGEASTGGDRPGESLEGVQSELTEMLALDKNPVVVPVRQELARHPEDVAVIVESRPIDG
jgi:hypothetical protein